METFLLCYLTALFWISLRLITYNYFKNWAGNLHRPFPHVQIHVLLKRKLRSLDMLITTTFCLFRCKVDLLTVMYCIRRFEIKICLN